MRQDMIALAIQITTQGDPKPNEYRIASWLSGQDQFIPASEIRKALGVAGSQIGDEVTLGIGSLLDALKQGQSIEEEQ